MATDKVDIAGTNAISASQMKEFFRLAANPGSHVNRETFQTFLEWKPVFLDLLEPETSKFLRLAHIIDAVRIEMGVSDEQFRALWTPEGRPYLEHMIAGLVDTIIRVDRSIRPVYPNWVEAVMHPELEAIGPAEYDLSAIDFWFHESQKKGRLIVCSKLYEHLRDNKMLESCLSLRDGEEIQKKGLATFRRFFEGEEVPLWKSVVRHCHGMPAVPVLFERDGQVMMNWYGLSEVNLSNTCPTLRFKSSFPDQPV